MKKTLYIYLMISSLLLSAAYADVGIRFDGVLGNSGADGERLVHLDRTDFVKQDQSAGLAYDRLGALWSFGGMQNILRMSLDGRMLGEYSFKYIKNQSHRLALADDWLAIRIGDDLYRLSITAESGSALEATELQVKEISLNAVDGRIGVVRSDGQVGIYTVASGEFIDLGELEKSDRLHSVALLPDGRVVVGGMGVYQQGQSRTTLQAKVNSMHQIVNGYVFELGWHMTVSRRNMQFEPDPGVIYGGSSGYFIGSLPEDGEMGLPRGIAHLGGQRYALVGPVGVIHLLVYEVDKQAFKCVRRLGAVHFPSALVLDERGRTWFYSGYWDWSDGPAAILKGETLFDSRDWDAVQGATAQNGQVLFPFLYRNEARLMHRSYDEASKRTSTALKEMPPAPTAMVVQSEGTRSVATIVNAQGQGIRLQLAANGEARKVRASFQMKLNEAQPAITSLALAPDDKLFAASNGAIVLLETDGDSYREIGRIASYQGPSGDVAFGPELYIDSAGDYLWVSDSQRNQVLLFRLDGHIPQYLDTFTGGALERALDRPQRIDAAGERAVVIDWGNQRILKLTASSD